MGKKPLTIAMLGLEPKGPSESEEAPEEELEQEASDELPMGLVEAMGELRAAEDDEAAARAFLAAMRCCEVD